MEKFFRAKLTSLTEIAQNTYEAKFNLESDNFNFKAGQYVGVEEEIVIPPVKV